MYSFHFCIFKMKRSKKLIINIFENYNLLLDLNTGLPTKNKTVKTTVETFQISQIQIKSAALNVV